MLIRSSSVILILVASADIALAEPVQEYDRVGAVTRSEGLSTVRDFVPAADPQNGQLLNAIPWPTNRTDSPFRVQNGRLWVTSGNIGSRTVVGQLPYGFPGPAGYGAPTSDLSDLIFVRSATGLPTVAISPWTDINSDTLEQIDDEVPFLWRTLSLTSTRNSEIRQELESAQLAWLDQQGYVKTVRQHVNIRARARAIENAAGGGRPEPSAIIRVHPPKPLEAQRPERDADRPDPIVRISTGEVREVESDRVVIRVVRPGETVREAADKAEKTNEQRKTEGKPVASTD